MIELPLKLHISVDEDISKGSSQMDDFTYSQTDQIISCSSSKKCILFMNVLSIIKSILITEIKQL